MLIETFRTSPTGLPRALAGSLVDHLECSVSPLSAQVVVAQRRVLVLVLEVPLGTRHNRSILPELVLRLGNDHTVLARSRTYTHSMRVRGLEVWVVI